MIRRRHGAAAGLVVVLACAGPIPDLAEGLPGEPLAGLTADEAASFAAGQRIFDRAFTPAEGLGPLFNQTRCSSCHDLPSSGGHGAEHVTRATRFDPNSGCSLLEQGGGDLLQSSVTPEGRAAGLLPERFPAGATAAAELQAPALYGLGLVEAVPLDDIAARADPDDRDGDGISGRLGAAADRSPGRFGLKAGHATLASFIEEAARGELGLTTPARPTEMLPQGRALPEGADPAPDPEVDERTLQALRDYVRFLAPPAVRASDEDEPGAIAEGSALFARIGCADCHVPFWTTGDDASPALSRKRFRAYSDFLLHDMGPELADICAPGAAPSEWRTAPLVGLGLRSAFLHDGRAQRLSDAVELHGGEAARARDLFRSQPERSRQSLIRFLQSL